MAIFKNVIKHGTLPKKFELSQNEPNPFKGKTIFRYSVPQTAKVIIMINNAEGKIVEKIVSEKHEAGMYEIEFYSDGHPGGTYFYHLISDDFFKSKEMELIK